MLIDKELLDWMTHNDDLTRYIVGWICVSTVVIVGTVITGIVNIIRAIKKPRRKKDPAGLVQITNPITHGKSETESTGSI